MMAVQWTKEQLEAIQARGSNILVAAAAGSGKTAVLVERIIRRICDEAEPVSVDNLLVLTFTEAAAAEMKRKIAQAIADKLQEEPDNPHLRAQNVLVHSAHISTIHSFCKTMIQNNIHQTDIPTDFTLIDPAENEVLRAQALDRVLERYYRRIGSKHAFRDLAIGYGGIKSDDNLRGTVLALHSFVRSMAYPERWLHRAAEEYAAVAKTKSLSGTQWETRLLNLCKELAEEAGEGYRCLARLAMEEIPEDLAIRGYFCEISDRFQEAYAQVLSGAETLDAVRLAQEGFQKGRATGMNKLDEQLAARIEYIRKKLIQPPLDEIKDLLAATEPEKLVQLAKLSPRVQVLKQLVRQTERLHQAMKRERSALDFNDLEHELLKLLADKKGNPTPVAKKLQTRFTEILVDEYQDTNDIQDTIFRMLSRDESNVFMVGDLKQCIYQFRNANPSIFAEKYHRYLAGDGGKCIRLFQNFRSRREVIDCVNYLFRALMTKELGGISYTEEEYLIQGAAYPENSGNVTTELLMTDTNEEHYDPDSSFGALTAYQKEAVTIAQRIKQLTESRELLICDRETKELRPLRLGDITILMQTSTHMEEVSRILEEHGIAVVDTAGRNYLDSLEVMTVLSFLQVIDNPLQDIPLLAVLRSGMFGFTPDELAEIRLCAEGNFYTALTAAAEGGNGRAAEFLITLNKLRDNAVFMGVDELIWSICYDLQYMALVGAMPGGSLRQENLTKLYEHGVAFEQGVLHGLFHFIGYMETLRAGNADFVSKSFADEKDMVTISTIHRSKGLEYPVVILYGMQQYFQESDAAKPVIWEEQSGIAMDWVDTVNRVRYTTLAKKLTRAEIIRQQRSEEMRLLYVALTRAKEKLILSCGAGKTRNGWKDAVYEDGRVVNSYARRTTCMRDWVVSALMQHPAAKPIREAAERMDILPDLLAEFALDARVIHHQEAPLAMPQARKIEKIKEEEPMHLPEELTQMLSYRYPHRELGYTPIKLSISELKRRQMPEEDYTPGILRLNKVVLSESTEIGAAERGTITHYVLQHLDEKQTDTLSEVEQQLSQMVEQGIISPRQREAVSAEKLYGFFCHPLGKRLKCAKEVCREFDFYMEIPAGEIMKQLPEEDQKESVLLQGIADCFFYEDDGVVLVDYKTDRVTAAMAEERAEQYRIQMECYEQGLSRILPVPIKEKYLYFLNCNTAVAL